LPSDPLLDKDNQLRDPLVPGLVVPLQVVAPLQAWASTGLRDLPWRRSRDPWHILVSEVMLQQTQISRVIERYHEFLTLFPTATSCAEGPLSAVIELWAGLGYNRRAVNLWKAAQRVVDEHDGYLPANLDALLKLPGIGPYTARAVQAFAFEHDVAVVDTNVGRLLARWTGTRLTPKQAQHLADELVPVGQGWMWNQSLFDFASAVCTKREPACAECPLQRSCAWKGAGQDPAINSAGVSTKQSRFDGSDRQVRGRLVDELRRSPIDMNELARYGRPADSAADVKRIADTLISDGLAVCKGGWLMLPD
jgi:A/G-specific adenine glycosylase